MLSVTPNQDVLGATIEGLDLSRRMPDDVFVDVLAALGRYGVLRFPAQELDSQALRDFSERFGRIQGSISERPKHGIEVPEVGVLSNVRKNGQFIGSPDAGQDWHTDMSYRDVMGFVNVLYGIIVPRRDGRVLGGTEFSNMHLACEKLPAEIKERLKDATATHDFNKFWEHMRRDRGSTRPPLTEEQRRRRPPVVHPVFMTHPLTGRKVLYCNPGYAERINELDEHESKAMLTFLFDHQLKDEFRYTHHWTEKDVLVWDHLGTIHRGIADYRSDEPRLMKRCQVMATDVFRPDFVPDRLQHQVEVHP